MFKIEKGLPDSIIDNNEELIKIDDRTLYKDLKRRNWIQRGVFALVIIGSFTTIFGINRGLDENDIPKSTDEAVLLFADVFAGLKATTRIGGRASKIESELLIRQMKHQPMIVPYRVIIADESKN